MIQRKSILAFLFVVLGLFGASAQAAPVTYTFSGNADGSVGGVNFAGQAFTITVTSDTVTAQNAVDPFTNVLTTGSIRIAGTACAAGCTITGAGGYLVFHAFTGPANSNVHGISTVGNPNVAGETLLEACFNCGGTQVDDDLVTPVSLATAGAANALAPYRLFATSGGNVQITTLNSVAYAVGVANQIPTLSEWAMILLSGLMAIGAYAALRRR